jgi:hypothetical protein
MQWGALDKAEEKQMGPDVSAWGLGVEVFFNVRFFFVMIDWRELLLARTKLRRRHVLRNHMGLNLSEKKAIKLFWS